MPPSSRGTRVHSVRSTWSGLRERDLGARAPMSSTGSAAARPPRTASRTGRPRSARPTSRRSRAGSRVGRARPPGAELGRLAERAPDAVERRRQRVGPADAGLERLGRDVVRQLGQLRVTQPSVLLQRESSRSKPDSRRWSRVPPPASGSSRNSTSVEPSSTDLPTSPQRHDSRVTGSKTSIRTGTRPYPSHSNQPSAARAGGRAARRWPNHAAARRPRSGRATDARARPGSRAAARSRGWSWWACHSSPRWRRSAAVARPRPRRTASATRRRPAAAPAPARAARSRPSRRTRTRPASRRTSRCLVTAWRVIGSPSPSAWIEAAPPWRRRSSSTRRVGSATATKTASMLPAMICNRQVACQAEKRIGDWTALTQRPTLVACTTRRTPRPARLAPFLAQWDYITGVLFERLDGLTRRGVPLGARRGGLDRPPRRRQARRPTPRSGPRPAAARRRERWPGRSGTWATGSMHARRLARRQPLPQGRRPRPGR